MKEIAVSAVQLVCFCALFWSAPFASAKPSIPKEGPPVLVPLDLKLEGRSPLRIVLRAKGELRSPVKFVLRGEAEFGRVRLLKQVAGDAVEVEYVPPADRSIRADSFLFAGSNAGGFSSDVRVRLQIVDEAPRLEVPQSLDFVATRVGKPTRLPLELRNSGALPGEWQISVSAPWALEEGSDKCSLAPGERKTIGVLFNPTQKGPSAGELRFAGADSGTVQLKANALDWVEVAKDPLTFVWVDSVQQSAELALSNTGVEPLEITLETSPPLDHAARIRIEAGRSFSVPLRWRGSLVPAGWGRMTLNSEAGMRRDVAWSLDAVLSGFGEPLVLTSDAGSVGVRRTFTNSGGRSGSWTFLCTPSFYVADAEQLQKEPAGPAPATTPSPLAPPTKVEVHATVPGFVWDATAGRLVPIASVAKAPALPKAETKVVPAAVPSPAKTTELTRSLRPGESFVLFIGINALRPVTGGTLFVNGPGQSREEPLLVRGDVRIEGGKPSANSVAAAAAKPLPAPPPGAAVNVAPLPPASPVPTQQPVTPGAAALPGISSGKAAAANAPAPHNIAVAEGAIVPGVFLAGFRVKDVTSNSATISFPVGQGVAPQHLVVRYRKIHPAEKGADPEKAPREEWIPFKGWKGKLIRSTDSSGERIDSTIEIRLSGLLPGASNDIDLIGPPESDGVRPILHQAEIFTPPAEVTLLPRKPWFWGVVAAVLGVACFLQRRAR